MILKLRFTYKANLFVCCLLLTLFVPFTGAVAQCAGTNNSVTICDISASSSKAINLFDILGPHESGGKWTDNFFSGGLNTTTGVLNAQLITKSGVYTYTYSVNNGSGCNDSATISVVIGGYAGVSSPNVSACSDDTNFNLFQGFNGSYLSPQSNGIWSDDENTGALVGSLLDATRAGVGTHTFTYTMPAIGSCPSQSSKVNVTVFRAAEPGIGNVIMLCDSEYQSFDTNLNLNNVLIGEDANGRWTEVSGTSELASSFDSTIDLRHIFETFGAGTYNFVYTVAPSNPICDIKKATATFIIEKQLDLSDATLVVNSDLCENQILSATYTAVLKQGKQKIDNGSYFVTYTISGVDDPITTISNFNDGFLNFGINRIFFPKVGNYTVSVIDVAKVGSLGACRILVGPVSDVVNIFPVPIVDKATLTIDPVCKGNDAIVKISGDTTLTEGNYSIYYNLSESNTAVAQQAFFKVAVGTGTFTIPAALIPVVGVIKIAITSITNVGTGCSSTTTVTKEFNVKPLPDVSNLTFDIKDTCAGQSASVTVSGLGQLSNVKFLYELQGANIALNQSIITAVSNGNASFAIPAEYLVNSGNTTLKFFEIIDNTGGCSAIPNSPSKPFVVNSVPVAPTGKNVIYCAKENKTVADLIPSGPQFKWYGNATSSNVLATTTSLATGTYYLEQVNASGCVSGRTAVNVVIDDIAAPILLQNGQNFCGVDNPTLKELTNNISLQENLVWFDAPSNGKIINQGELLRNGSTYYAFNSSSITNCYSNPLAVTVSLTDCNVTSELFIPDGFSPNGDGINDTFRIPDIEYIFPNYSLEIYNRYGALMFKGNSAKAEWDGRNSEANISIDGMASNGIYFYVLNFNKGNKEPQQGRIYLSR